MINSCPTIIHNYSKDSEVDRVKYVYNELGWYRERGYDVRLPGGRRLSECETVPPLAELLTELDAEFAPHLYDKAASRVEGGWQVIAEQWPTLRIEATSLTFKHSYNIHLTRYGTGGSYNLPNEIVLNIESGDAERFERILFHEMIHLCIESLVQKYNTPHWYKERIVDLTFKKLMPEIAFEQNLPRETLAVDSIYKNYYGDFEKVVEYVSKLTESSNN